VNCEVRFPVPPVPTGAWTEEDWDNWIAQHGVTVNAEPDTLDIGGETWAKTGKRNRRGEALYRKA